MTKEEAKKIQENAPQGATHYDKGFGFYFDASDKFNVKKYVNGEWVECRFRSGSQRFIVYVGE